LNSLLIIGVIAFSCSFTALAQSSQLERQLSVMNKVGAASFRFMFWSIYEAELYTEQPEFVFEEFPEFILRLNYQRSFSSKQILDETYRQLTELNQTSTENINAWISKLESILVDVKKGDRISLHVDERGHSNFFLNNLFLGEVEDEKFSKNFSSIWLARTDRYAAFTRNLTGQTL
jgi:hypothetical protein